MKIKINTEKTKITLKEMINKNLIKIENEKKLNELLENKNFLIRINLKYFYEKKYLMKNENYIFIEKYYIKLNDLKNIENDLKNIEKIINEIEI